MNRQDYLNRLQLTLEASDFGPVEEAISYFNEILEDRILEEGMDEEAAIATMESPEEVARKLVHSKSSAAADPAPEPAPADEPFISGVRIINARAEQVRKIIIKDRNMRLKIRGWSREDIELQHPETDRIRYDFSLQDGEMALIRQPMEFSFNLLLFKNSDPSMREVNLFVPYELAAEMDLRTSNGRLDAKNFALWGKASFITSNAKMDVENVGAKDLLIKGSNGAIDLEKIQSKHSLTVTSSNGKIKAEKIHAPDAVTLSTSNARITVEDVDTAVLQMGTSNGRIEGKLPGRRSDYSIVSGTSNGKNNLPRQQQGGSKSLSAKTSNGRIEVNFREGD